MTPARKPCPPPDLLFAMAEGALAEPEAARVKEHLLACEQCRRVFDASGELKDIAWVLSNVKLNSRDHERIERCKNRVREELDLDLPPGRPSGSFGPAPQ